MSPRSLASRARTPVIVTISIGVLMAAFLVKDAVLPVAAPATPTPIVTPKPVKPFTPVSFAISKIDVDAPIVPVGTLADGKMGSPKTAHEVGWWAGRKPGQGNVLLDGHRDWSGANGSFYRLKDLAPGDEVVVKGDGPKEQATYRILWIKNYDRTIDATDLLGNDTGEQIATLITCAGQFNSSAGTAEERLVARAVLV